MTNVRSRKHRHARLAAIAIAALAVTSCANASAPTRNATPTRSTSLTAVPSIGTVPHSSAAVSPPSASPALATYFATAEMVSQRLKAAAAVINRHVTTTQLNIDQETRDAIDAADPAVAARAIPAGLPAGLLRHVMIVQSDLVSRHASLRGYLAVDWDAPHHSVPISGPIGRHVMGCLGRGAEAANLFASDLAAARAAAAHAPPVVIAAPDSRAAAEVTVLVHWINGWNRGCGSCGGERKTSLPPLAWYPQRTYEGPADARHPVDGTIDGIGFLATYVTGKGWEITLYAC